MLITLFGSNTAIIETSLRKVLFLESPFLYLALACRCLVNGSVPLCLLAAWFNRKLAFRQPSNPTSASAVAPSRSFHNWRHDGFSGAAIAGDRFSWHDRTLRQFGTFQPPTRRFNRRRSNATFCLERHSDFSRSSLGKGFAFRYESCPAAGICDRHLDRLGCGAEISAIKFVINSP